MTSLYNHCKSVQRLDYTGARLSRVQEEIYLCLQPVSHASPYKKCVNERRGEERRERIDRKTVKHCLHLVLTCISLKLDFEGRISNFEQRALSYQKKETPLRLIISKLFLSWASKTRSYSMFWPKGWLPIWLRTSMLIHQSRKMASHASLGVWNTQVSSTSWSCRPRRAKAI